MATYVREGFSSLAECEDFLGKRERKLIGYKTTMRRQGDGFAIRQHDTDVLTFHPNGGSGMVVTLDSGGWKTVTTKDRLDSLSPRGVSLRQKGGIWYVGIEGDTFDYVDGMEIHTSPNLHIADIQKVREGELNRKKEEDLRKQIKRYCRGFARAWKAGEVKDPSGGDCWMCLMFDKDGAMSSVDHLEEHMKEKYYVPSLLYNSLVWAGYQDPGFIWSLIRQDPESFTWHARCLRRYLYRRFGLVA